MTLRLFKLLVLFLLLFEGASALCEGVTPARSREEFASALGRIKENMTTNDVLAILGQPDDVRTQFDPGGISRVQTKEIWCYGSKGHLSFPTLGCVYIDMTGRTQEVFGGKGHPPKPGLFTENELQDLLRLLDTAPELEGYNYNPLALIQIVNTLQPLGKEKSLAAIGEYLRVSNGGSDFSGPRSGMFLVLRVLFDLPDDIDPGRAGLFGMPNPAGPKNHHQIPRFPIALVDDIPLMLAGGYSVHYMSMAGDPTPLENDLRFFRANGQLRTKLLVPGNNPLAALSHLVKSKQWIYADSKLAESDWMSFGDAETNEREKSILMEQLLRLIDSVYRLPTDALGNRLPCGASPDPTWQKIIADVSALKIKWDANQQMYEFQDGTHLPKLSSKIHQREIWRLTGMGYEDAELILERKSDDWVDVIVTLTEKAGSRLKSATLILFSEDANQPPLQTFDLTSLVGVGESSAESRTISLKEGSELNAKLVIPGYRTNSSFLFKP